MLTLECFACCFWIPRRVQLTIMMLHSFLPSPYLFCTYSMNTWLFLELASSNFLLKVSLTFHVFHSKRGCETPSSLNWLKRLLSFKSLALGGSLESNSEAFSQSVHSSVTSNCLRPNGLQHASPPCPSPTPGAYLNSCP